MVNVSALLNIGRVGQGESSSPSESAAYASSECGDEERCLRERLRRSGELREGEEINRAFSCSEQAIRRRVAMGPSSAWSSIHWRRFKVRESRKA